MGSLTAGETRWHQANASTKRAAASAGGSRVVAAGTACEAQTSTGISTAPKLARLVVAPGNAPPRLLLLKVTLGGAVATEVEPGAGGHRYVGGNVGTAALRWHRGLLAGGGLLEECATTAPSGEAGGRVEISTAFRTGLPACGESAHCARCTCPRGLSVMSPGTAMEAAGGAMAAAGGEVTTRAATGLVPRLPHREAAAPVAVPRGSDEPQPAQGEREPSANNRVGLRVLSSSTDASATADAIMEAAAKLHWWCLRGGGGGGGVLQAAAASPAQTLATLGEWRHVVLDG